MSARAALRRSPIARALDARGATWKSLADASVPMNVDVDASKADVLLVDLSPLPRLGFKGRGTMEAMEKRGLVFKPEPNRAFRQPDGGLCLVLAKSEVILLGPQSGEDAALVAFETSWSIDDAERSYPVPRRDGSVWFRVVGPASAAMFAKICGVDLRAAKFPHLAIAQTSVARLNAVICRDDAGSRHGFHLLADAASGLYLFECLTDAMSEFGGKIGGIADL